MTFSEALAKRKAVDFIVIRKGDLVGVNIPALHPSTGREAMPDSYFTAMYDYEGPPTFQHQLCANYDLLHRATGHERMWIPPFPKSNAARDWVLRDTMGSLYDPDRPRNDGPMPETEWE